MANTRKNRRGGAKDDETEKPENDNEVDENVADAYTGEDTDKPSEKTDDQSTSTASSNQLGEFRAGAFATAIGPIGATIMGGALGFIICIVGILKFPMLWKLDKISDLEKE